LTADSLVFYVVVIETLKSTVLKRLAIVVGGSGE